MTRFLAANWLWIVVIVAMVAMHRRGGCGMHGGHHQHQHQSDEHRDHAHSPAGDERASSPRR